MQPPKSDICVICGVRPADTVDHVPPKGFFKGVVNAQLRTVPCCRDCNNGASSDDEDLRFYLSAQIGKENSASKVLWDDDAYKTSLSMTKSEWPQDTVAGAGQRLRVQLFPSSTERRICPFCRNAYSAFSLRSKKRVRTETGSPPGTLPLFFQVFAPSRLTISA